MSELSEYVATIETTAASEFLQWVDGVEGWDEMPESIRALARSFFIAGFFKGSSSGASVTWRSAKKMIGEIRQEVTTSEEAEALQYERR